MDKSTIKLTVFFEEAFWVGIFEQIENGKLSVAKVIFGAEPKDYKVFEFILRHYYYLQFSAAVTAVVKETKKNPKRMQRDVKTNFLLMIISVFWERIRLYIPDKLYLSKRHERFILWLMVSNH